MDVIRKVKFKAENNTDRSNTQKQNKNGGGEQDKLNKTSFAQHRNMKRVILIWFRNAYVKNI